MLASEAGAVGAAVRISTTYRPELALGRQRSRASLPDLYLDVPARRLVAMDGQVLVALPVSVSRRERSGFVAGDALRAARRRGPVQEEARLKARAPGRSRDARLRAFPGWRSLLPRLHRGARGATSVTVHLSQLQRVADAMGVVAVTLTVPARGMREQGAILVQPVDPKASELGVIFGSRSRPGAPPMPWAPSGFPSRRVRALPRGPRSRRWSRGARSLEAEADRILAAGGSGHLVAEELR